MSCASITKVITKTRIVKRNTNIDLILELVTFLAEADKKLLKLARQIFFFFLKYASKCLLHHFATLYIFFCSIAVCFLHRDLVPYS